MGGLAEETSPVRGQKENEQRDAARMVSKEKHFLGVVLAEVEDMAVDTAKVPLHDAWHDEEMRRVERRFGPRQGSRRQRLAGHRRGQRPNTVLFDHVAFGPAVQVSEGSDSGWEIHASLAVGPLDERASQGERFKKLSDWKGALNLEIRVPNATAQPIGAFFDKDLSWNMDHLQLAAME
jgi:hypothetical protein